MLREQLFDHATDLVIVGPAIRTAPAQAAADIPALWQRFMSQEVARLPARDGDESVYAVYCDYESDWRGAYTTVLGAAVSARAEVPSGMRRVRIPAGHYARFAVEGDPTQVLWRTWSAIHESWSRRQDRRYIADYERYAPGAMSPEHVKAAIAVGLA